MPGQATIYTVQDKPIDRSNREIIMHLTPGFEDIWLPVFSRYKGLPEQKQRFSQDSSVTNMNGLNNELRHLTTEFCVQTNQKEESKMNPRAKKKGQFAYSLCWFNGPKEEKRECIEKLRILDFNDLSIGVRMQENEWKGCACMTVCPSQIQENKTTLKTQQYDPDNIRISDSFLETCIRVAQSQIETERLLKKETVNLLRELSEEIREIRIKLGENRATFSQRVGIDLVDLVEIEHITLFGDRLYKCLVKIDHVQHSNLKEKFELLFPHPEVR